VGLVSVVRFNRTESRVAERIVIGLTAWLTKVMIRGCRGSDTETFYTAV
jgi:hypothetical protein